MLALVIAGVCVAWTWREVTRHQREHDRRNAEADRRNAEYIKAEQLAGRAEQARRDERRTYLDALGGKEHGHTD